MFKFLLVVPVILTMAVLGGCGRSYTEPFVQCTVWTKAEETFGKCLNYELACVKPLIIRAKHATSLGVTLDQSLICVLPENYGKTSPGL